MAKLPGPNCKGRTVATRLKIRALLIAVGLCTLGGLDAAVAQASESSPSAASRPPEQRQVLIDLAYRIGESHALRRICKGEVDGYWFDRMQRLLKLEQPDANFSRQLVDRFNAGFVSRQAEFTECTAQSRAAARETDALGEGLARKLAGGAPQ
jgi:uncharacterized protein (TIGR02301 family)